MPRSRRRHVRVSATQDIDTDLRLATAIAAVRHSTRRRIVVSIGRGDGEAVIKTSGNRDDARDKLGETLAPLVSTPTNLKRRPELEPVALAPLKQLLYTLLADAPDRPGRFADVEEIIERLGLNPGEAYQVYGILLLTANDTIHRRSASELADGDAERERFRREVARFRRWYVRQLRGRQRRQQHAPTPLLRSLNALSAKIAADTVFSSLQDSGRRRRGRPKKPELDWAFKRLKAWGISRDDARDLLEAVGSLDRRSS